MTLVEDHVSIGETSSKLDRKVRGISNMMIFCDMFNKLLVTSIGLLIRLSLMISLLGKKTRLLVLTEFLTVFTAVLVGLVRSSSIVLINFVLEGNTIPDCFAESRTVFIPKTSGTDDLGRIIRSPDALRPLTLCNCDCKLLTSAICRGLHWYTMRCIHPSQRCISSRQMTDNIFEIETTALADVGCAPQDSGVLLTDSAAAYPSVTHSWIFSVLENTGLPDFLCRFQRSIYKDSITHVEFAGAERGHFLMARGVRQGCPASGFLFAMAFDQIFRWLQESVIPKIVGNLEFLQPTQCAYDDDLAIASSSFRELMLVLAIRGSSLSNCC